MANPHTDISSLEARVTLPFSHPDLHYVAGWLCSFGFWFPTQNHIPRRPDLMFIPTVQGASALTASAATASTSTLTPTPTAEPIRHMLFGSLGAVQSTIRVLHKRGYAEVNDWSQPISTGRPNEVMAILTKRVMLEHRDT
ncbi:MAG: hypothetical protein WBA01_04225 [Phormidesmis sp.]